jgi:NADH dehydrogenase
MDVVTGAFGYTGRAIARKLVEEGKSVVTLTGNPGAPNEFGSAVKAAPYRFDDPAAMAEAMAGARILYNTYWVRFDRGSATHERAEANTIALIRAAEMAGVRRIVHISITNPRAGWRLPYFQGKAQLEEEIQRSKLSYAIVRPTVIFGGRDILINNIAYLLRKYPLFLIPGDGEYKLQPVYIDDLARIAVEAGRSVHNLTIDAVGPEIFGFKEMVSLIARTIGRKVGLVKVPPEVALFGARVLGIALGDVVLTRDEVDGLMAGLLVSEAAPTGEMRFSSWLSANASKVGLHYASEVGRHYSLKAGAKGRP